MLSTITKDNRFSFVETQIEKMQKRADEFCQSRSNFQIEKFIACDEYTPITQFRHIAHNSYVAAQEARRSLIERERLTRKITKLEFCLKHNVDLENAHLPSDINKSVVDPHFNDYDLDIYEASRQLDNIDIRIKGLLKEINYMEAICDTLEENEISETGTGFTAEKYQEREPEYWDLRLKNQAHRSQIGTNTGVGEGNYMSILNACAEPIIKNSKNTIGKISLDINELAVSALLPRSGVNEKFLVDKPTKPEELTSDS